MSARDTNFKGLKDGANDDGVKRVDANIYMHSRVDSANRSGYLVLHHARLTYDNRIGRSQRSQILDTVDLNSLQCVHHLVALATGTLSTQAFQFRCDQHQLRHCQHYRGTTYL